MSLKVCLSTANTLTYPQGGHLWVFLNWALGLRSCGCDVAWLDVVPPTLSTEAICKNYGTLQHCLAPFGLEKKIVLDVLSDQDSTGRLGRAQLPCLSDLGGFDLLVDLRYNLPQRLFANFRRTILIEIDPGLYQIALAGGAYPEPRHDLLFSTGETTGQPGAKFTSVGKHWLHASPCVFLPEWPFTPGSISAPWTTIAHWWGDWMVDDAGEAYENSKREGFRPFLTIASRTRARFELALNVEDPIEERLLESYGFRVHDAHKIASTPLDFRFFVQRSAGEFSCAKPSYVKLQTAWISDRTLCYLATGRPCVVEDTGPSRFLPSDRGLHRFSDLKGAVAAIESVIANYESEAQAARFLAEEFFDAEKVCRSILERAL